MMKKVLILIITAFSFLMAFNACGNLIEKPKVPMEQREERLRNATSVEEVRELLDGTKWYYTEANPDSKTQMLVLSIEFDGDSYKYKYSRLVDGVWKHGGAKSGYYSCYKDTFSDTHEDYIAVDWQGDIYAHYSTVTCDFSFVPSRMRFSVRSWAITKPVVGDIHFGEYPMN